MALCPWVTVGLCAATSACSRGDNVTGKSSWAPNCEHKAPNSEDEVPAFVVDDDPGGSEEQEAP
jgi:hypothetical protein